jgi:hypothetical protein
MTQRPCSRTKLPDARLPDRTHVLSGALDTHRRKGATGRGILDAAARMELMATGRGLDLDEARRARATHLPR